MKQISIICCHSSNR